jgi:hypothetical protein
MNVTGDYLQELGGILSFSIAGAVPAEEYSQLDVDGNLQIAGTIRLSFEDGFAPQAGQTFDLITVGGTSQLGSLQFEIENLAPGFQFDFAPFAGGYRLTALTDGQAILPSDFNADFEVDADDLATWRTYFGATGLAPHDHGDADYDRDVDGDDFLFWQREFGGMPDASPSIDAIPEPSAACLALAWLLLVRQNRRRFGNATGPQYI